MDVAYLNRIKEFLSSLDYEGKSGSHYYFAGLKRSRTEAIRSVLEYCTSIVSESEELVDLKIDKEITKSPAAFKNKVETALNSVLLARESSGVQDASLQDAIIGRDVSFENAEFLRSVEKTPGSGRPPYYFLLDKTTRTAIFDSVADMHLMARRKGIDLETQDVPEVALRYNPLDPAPVFKSRVIGSTITCVNLYRPPQWKFLKGPSGDPKIPLAILEHLFPLPEERKYVMGWIYNAVVGRNNTVLVLLGSRGAGKTVFSNLLRALLGPHQSCNLNSDSLLGRFNGEMKDQRLGIFEETGLDGAEGRMLQKMKEIMNSKIRIEGKGKEAMTSDNYMSFIMCLNPSTELGISPHERRFSLPEVSRKDLRTSVSPEDINLREVEWAKEDPSDAISKELKGFFEYIEKHRDPGQGFNEALKGEYYWRVTYAGLKVWQKFFIEELQSAIISNGGVMKYSDFCTALRKKNRKTDSSSTHAPKYRTLNNFIDDFVPRCGGRLAEKGGDIDTRDDAQVFVASEEFTRYTLDSIKPEDIL